MIRSFRTAHIPDIFSGYTAKPFGEDSYLLTPGRGVFPRFNLVIERRLFFTPEEISVNGPQLILLSPDEAAQVAAATEFSLQGQPQSILFLAPIAYEGNKVAYRVVRPCQATHLGVITKWDRSGQSKIGVGASKRYARSVGAEVQKHSPKSKQRGQDFWLIPTRLLTDPAGLLDTFDKAWAYRIEQAILDHAQKFPRDGDQIAACRRWLAEGSVAK